MTASQANAEYTTETFSLNYQNMPQYNLNSEFKPSSTMNFSDTKMEYSANKNYYMEEAKTGMQAKSQDERNSFRDTMKAKSDDERKLFRDSMQAKSQDERKAFRDSMRSKNGGMRGSGRGGMGR